ncbi:MAG: class I SAM-dependent methyltransferase [Pseudolabrys sp.]
MIDLSDVPPLEADICRRIKAAGPMPVAEFMQICLADPQHGYYATRDPLGASGDFTTAPEVSQMFGELIGLWMAAVWKQMGSPENVRVIELGPGRGTLMNDAIRAAKVMPDFISAAVIHLVEISKPLRARQEETLAPVAAPKFWHNSLADVPAGPAIIVANEFFDALPVNQAVKQPDGWHTRVVKMDEHGLLEFDIAPEPIPQFERLLPPRVRNASPGDIFEWRSDRAALELGRRVAREPGAALVIDYGHAETDVGDTLQAVGGHAFADPLSAPGTVDLTAHVDFEALLRAAESMGAIGFGPIEQWELLRNLGIETRAQTLKANADRANARQVARDVDAAVARLTGRSQKGMGALFKAVALAHRAVGVPPAFSA